MNQLQEAYDTAFDAELEKIAGGMSAGKMVGRLKSKILSKLTPGLTKKKQRLAKLLRQGAKDSNNSPLMRRGLGNMNDADKAKAVSRWKKADTRKALADSLG